MASLRCILLLSVISIFFLLSADGISTVPQHSNDSKVTMMFSNSSQPNAPAKTPSSNNDVTHYLLVLQWPPSVCNSVKYSGKICNTPIPQDFKLHGLWPQGKAGSLLDCVPSAANKFNTIEVFKVTKLATVWPQLFKGENKPSIENVNFWRHEWDKHGACSGLNPVDYFKKAVNLYDTLKLKLLLENYNVQPGNMYAPRPDIIDVLPRKQKPKVTCGVNIKGQFQIQELSFNVTAAADNIQPITLAIKVSDCPNRGYNPVGFPN
ncbi:Ribonuclease t2 protein [Thalictrum thalictroides]|uniref:Ribonuclease t2 protein n=1 Tax=Thalictrum thalictroides TaxID=46969 RepID=A0A7J6WYS0_THATH|nr:Ribonuclease t2 protein [Thalictrum thalictroides]